MLSLLLETFDSNLCGVSSVTSWPAKTDSCNCTFFSLKTQGFRSDFENFDKRAQPCVSVFVGRKWQASERNNLFAHPEQEQQLKSSTHPHMQQDKKKLPFFGTRCKSSVITNHVHAGDRAHCIETFFPNVDTCSHVHPVLNTCFLQSLSSDEKHVHVTVMVNWHQQQFSSRNTGH